MIKSIYLMDENGILLYSKEIVKQNYDTNILIGFFSSIVNFSREALGTAVRNINLGESNKLILVPYQEEGILGAIIGSEKDNNELLTQIIRNVTQEFIDAYSPDYNVEKILNEEMDKIINRNLRIKTIKSPMIRFLISWLIVAPVSYFLVMLSIIATTYIYELFNLDRFLVTQELFFTRFLPSLIGISTVDIIILFLLPNLILGYLSPNWKFAIASSMIHLALTIILFYNSMQPIFTYIIIGYLPLALIFSLFFLFIGSRSASKRFLKIK